MKVFTTAGFRKYLNFFSFFYVYHLGIYLELVYTLINTSLSNSTFPIPKCIPRTQTTTLPFHFSLNRILGEGIFLLHFQRLSFFQIFTSLKYHFKPIFVSQKQASAIFKKHITVNKKPAIIQNQSKLNFVNPKIQVNL